MKKYVITGSVGNISKPLIEGLIKAGKEVSVITSSNDRKSAIEKLGATALVGSIFDVEFLKSAFQHADAVYTMIPPNWQTTNWRASQNEVANNYHSALKATGVKRIVNLSSIGAHMGNGAGPVDGLADFEKMLNNLSAAITHLRPSYFYYNLISQIGLIKQAGIMGGNFGEPDQLFLVHPRDIAAVALEELLKPTAEGIQVRYIIGDQRTGKEIATVLGNAIGRELPWVVFTDEQQKQGLLQAGLSETHATAFTEMGKAIRTGTMQSDAMANKPAFSHTKLEDFAKEFAAAYNN